MFLFPTKLDFGEKMLKKLRKYEEFTIERIRHKQNFYGLPIWKYKVPINAPIAVAHYTISIVDYLYVRAKTKRGRIKTFISGTYSPENLAELKDFLERVRGNKP
jgi:hypothetical protein